MKSATKKILLCTAALAVMAVAWWSWTRDGGSSAGVVTMTKRKAAVVERSSLPLTAKAPEKPLPQFGTPEFKQMILERCAKWMESRGRDSASLIAMWDLAGDETLLLEAAEKFPDDPRVCAAMIAHLVEKGGDALPWAERLIANEPDNPAGHYLKASALGKAGRREEALEALRTAVGKGGKPEPHLRGRTLTAREAVLAGGGTVKEAAFAALAGPRSKAGLPVLAGGALKALREEMREAKEAGDTDRAVETAALGAAVTEHQRFAEGRNLMDDLVSNSILRLMLGELPPDMEYGDGEKTAGERLAEIEAEKDQTKAILESQKQRDDFIDRFTEGLASEFTDRVILHGERAAMQWLTELSSKSLPAQTESAVTPPVPSHTPAVPPVPP